jgi:hypothetical protein
MNFLNDHDIIPIKDVYYKGNFGIVSSEKKYKYEVLVDKSDRSI